MPAQQSRRYSWTLNNYTEDHINLLRLSIDNDLVSYLIAGKEVGAEGTPHLQGYLEIPKRMTLLSIKDKIGIPELHLEISKGTAQQNKTYCSKDGPLFLNLGVPMKPGKRSDLDAVIEDVRAGMDLRSLWENHTNAMVRMEKGIRRAITMLAPIPPAETYPLDSFKWTFDKDFTKSIILWGAAGIGKTCFAQALIPNALFISHIDDLVNFDPTVHGGLIFDDMDFKHIPRTAQIHLVDQDFPRSIHCRYTTSTIPAHTRKIFTTNEHNGYCLLTEDPAIKRRVRIINLL